MIQSRSRATGVARMDVIKGSGVAGVSRDIASINDPDALRRIAKERNIAFAPTASVERMKKRLMEP